MNTLQKTQILLINTEIKHVKERIEYLTNWSFELHSKTIHYLEGKIDGLKFTLEILEKE